MGKGERAKSVKRWKSEPGVHDWKQLVINFKEGVPVNFFIVDETRCVFVEGGEQMGKIIAMIS